jgi:hypothetical protein
VSNMSLGYDFIQSRALTVLCDPGDPITHGLDLVTGFATRTTVRAAGLLRFSTRTCSSTHTIQPTTVFAMAPTAIGLALSKEHKIGKLIGQGAFGDVHAVTLGMKETNWACKLTPHVTKKTRKGNSALEIAYMLLWSENLLYSQQFRNMCGTMLPKLPSAAADGLDVFYDNRGGAYENE